MRKFGFVMSVLLGLLVSPASAEPQVGFPRHPALSPDGSVLVFSWAGDLWAVASDGGPATRLTSHPAEETAPAFSPDGSLLAFESDRDGARNLFVMSISMDGGVVLSGVPQRVTVSDRSQRLTGFSADGEALLFSGSQEPSLYRHARMYRAPLDGGPVTRLTDAYGMHPRQAVNGDVLFTRGYLISNRPAYRGTGRMDIWRMRAGDGSFTRLSRFEGNDTDAHQMPDGSVVFVSSRSGQNNIHRLRAGAIDGERNAVSQLTDFQPTDGRTTIGHGVRDLTVSADGKVAAFCVWDTLYTLDLSISGAAPKPVGVRPSGDDAIAETSVVDISRRASEVAMHPSGKAVAVVLRGEIFVRAADDDRPARRVTDSHARERDIAWSPCGTKLYYARDDGESLGSIFVSTVRISRDDISRQDDAGESVEDGEGDKPEPKVDFGALWANALTFHEDAVVTGATHDFGPNPSPDGKKLLFVRGLGDLMMLDLESGAERTIFEGWNIPDVQWASDSRHIVYAVADLDFNTDIWLLDTALEDGAFARKPRNITRHPDLDSSPRLSHDGKVLVFLSDRSGNNFEYDVYGVFLDKTLETLPRFELDKYFEEAARAARGLKPLEPDAKPVEPLKFDVDDAFMRIRRLTSIPGSTTNLALTPGGDRIIFSASIDGSRSLYSVDPRGGDRRQIAGSVGNVAMSLTGDRVVFLSGGQAASAAPTGGRSTTYAVSAEARVNITEQQRQKFHEGAGRFGESFYHPTMKGLDWEALTREYADLAQKTRTSAEFNDVFNMLLGEVNGSHTGISGGERFSAPSAGNGYLGVDAEPEPGGYRVTRVLDGGPAALGRMGLEPGDLIISIDQAPLASSNASGVRDLHAALAGTSGAETLLEIIRGDENRLVLLRPWSFGAENNLRYTHEVMARRELVERLSDGRLGYLHIRGMSMPSVRDFERDLYAAAHGREGLVIDVRDNGGGSTTDILLASLTAPAHAYTIPRGADPASVPTDAYPRDRRLIYGWTRPINVLINQNSFSNAEIFAHSIKTIGRGTIIGTATFGGVISTGSMSLIDGTTIRRPFRGWYLPDGRDMDKHGAEPDIRVSQEPDDEVAGRDRQLEAAVTEMLNRIDSGG